jgi:hypothetical protein
MPGGAALGWILLGAFVLRLWSLGHGLPYVYSTDEEQHFVPRAVAMVGGSLDPNYFENPPALTYLFWGVFKLRFHAGFPFGSSGLLSSFKHDPTAVFTTARFVVVLLGTLSVGLIYWAGRRFYDRRVGLVAAVLLACAFLPVFYAKQALNDAVTLVPITVALVGCLAVYEHARARDWVLAGAAIGVAGAAIIDAIGVTLEASVTPQSSAGFNPFGQGAVTTGSTDVVLGAPVDVRLVVLAICLAAVGGLLAGAGGGLRAARLRPADALRSAE